MSINPYDIFPDLADPTYDNPDILYNEECLSYDGEWNLTCLYRTRGIQRKGGRSAAGVVFKSTKKPKQYPDQETIDLLFNVHITKDGKTLSDIKKKYQVLKSESYINIAAEKVYETKETMPFISISDLVHKNEKPEAKVSGLLILKEKPPIIISSSFNKQIRIKTISIDTKSGLLGIKKVRVASLLESNLSPCSLNSLVFNKMTKFPIKE